MCIRDRQNNGQQKYEYKLSLYNSFEKGDTAAWIKSLEEGILKFPGNDYFFANLVDYYNTSCLLYTSRCV